MRCLTVWLGCVIALGCTAAPGDADTVPTGPDTPLPPDLRTRNTGSDWPGFLGPTGDSVSTEKGITPWPKEGLPVLWSIKVGEGYALPTTSRGRLFLFDRIGNKARLRTLKSETGEPLWTFDYPTNYEDTYGYSGGPRCYPVVDGPRVYILGPEGMLHCLRAEDGKLVWKIDTNKEFNVIQNFFGVGSTPIIEKDLLICQIGGSPPGSQDVAFDLLKGNGSGVVAFDKYTGKVRYKISDELASYSSPVLATIGDRRWCFVFARGGLIGFEPATGKVDFHYPWRARILESVNASNPVVVGNRVLITETYGAGAALLEVAPGSVKEIWTDEKRAARDKVMQCHWNTPIHVNGYLYGSSGRHTSNAEMRCIELATGKVLWSEPGLTRSSLLLVDNHFISQGEDGVLRLLKVNPQKYEEVSRMVVYPRGPDGKPDLLAPSLLKYPCWCAPALSHGLLYVRGDGHLVCLELFPAKKN